MRVMQEAARVILRLSQLWWHLSNLCSFLRCSVAATRASGLESQRVS